MRLPFFQSTSERRTNYRQHSICNTAAIKRTTIDGIINDFSYIYSYFTYEYTNKNPLRKNGELSVQICINKSSFIHTKYKNSYKYCSSKLISRAHMLAIHLHNGTVAYRLNSCIDSFIHIQVLQRNY